MSVEPILSRSNSFLVCERATTATPPQRGNRFAIIATLFTKIEDGSFRGQLKTLSIRAEIEIVENGNRIADTQPHYRVLSDGVEIGAGWMHRAESSGRDYVSLSLAAPEFGPRRLYANRGQAAGGPDDRSAVIWNLAD